MKRTSIALFAASLGLFLLSLANLSPVVSAQLPMPKDDGGGTPSDPPPSTPVEVTNAITGTMDVRNSPLRQEVFGNVDVGNLPLNADGNLITAPATPSQLEVLTGGFNCGTGSGGRLEVFLSFVGTAGIAENGYKVMGGNPEHFDRAEICNEQVSRIIAKANSLDCTTGQVKFTNESGFAQPANFAFVCQGSRNSLVDIIFELTQEFLAINVP